MGLVIGLGNLQLLETSNSLSCVAKDRQVASQSSILYLLNDSAKLMGKQVWQATDGELFDTEEDCLRHERASLLLSDINNNEKFAKNEERWGLQKNFSRHFIDGFMSVESFWNYAESFRVMADILDGRRSDHPKDSLDISKTKAKLLPASKRKRR